MELIEKVISSEVVYDGIVFNVVKDEVLLPNGKMSKRQVLEGSNAVVILPITEEGEIILVRQYRHPVKKVLLELPAGKLEKDEDIKEAAYRELREETGYIADNMEEYGNIIPAAGYASEILYGFISRGLKEKDIQDLDEDEFINVEKVSPEKLKEMIFKGEITDGKTIALVLKYLLENK